MSASPDKPLGFLLTAIRRVVRRIRMASLRIRANGRLEAGENAYIARGASLYIPTFARIGTNVSVGANFVAQTDFVIGDECLLSSNVSFVGNDHDLYGPSAYFSGRLPPSKIVLEGNNFIGFGATIVGNVTLGRGAMVAAGAVVISNVEQGMVVAGVPARVVKQRYKSIESELEA
ncbi:acyltransferase [Noviluteimonas dokdonensis]|uniref:acyltransferase n=1 Tax=Noviluteimonas dokdonensis TaxID=414050 RepID=UPI0009FB9798|nr:acyltransferase [Lysobacter dokdonensis]